METILLPSLLNRMDVDGLDIRDCVLSSPPRASNDDESMVFFINGAGESPEYTIVFCSVGDTKWYKHKLIDKFPKKIDFYSGKLYAMCLNDDHLEIEIQHVSDISSEKTLSVTEFNIAPSSTYIPMLEYSWVLTHYVRSCGETFKIQIYGNPRGVYMQVFSINIWKMNLSLLTLEEVKSMGDHVFFLGKNNVLSCSAAELGFTKGCLYFTLPDEMSLYIYEIEDNSMLLSLPCPDVPSPWFSSSWLLIPTTFKVM
ncbi:hypothetical protein MKW92_030571 [Papaver armeniacum]|nr:hypothetical protein MKW92_030571 [Papaver armeniacum]